MVFLFDIIFSLMSTSKSKIELRGFAPIGLLEQWSIGMMVLNDIIRSP
jgi:hypothetical protein